MTRMVCVKCQVKLKPKKNGVTVVETFGRDSDEPYKLWDADLWECPDCGVQIVSGFAQHNYAEHYQPDFQAQLDRASHKYWDKSC